jgi:hypothetical protein
MGIHSLSKPSDAKIIFAANSFLTNYVNGFLQANGIKNSPCVGSYQGILENSWIVNYDQLSKIKHLLINEQSILLLDQPNSRNELKATLIFLDENVRFGNRIFTLGIKRRSYEAGRMDKLLYAARKWFTY